MIVRLQKLLYENASSTRFPPTHHRAAASSSVAAPIEPKNQTDPSVIIKI